MAGKTPVPGKKYFTVAQANATLPLVRAIVRDIIRLAPELRERAERLRRIMPSADARVGEAHLEEIEHLQAELDRDQDQMNGYFAELQGLGIELKDAFTGLLDFPCWMDNREVYLCWRYGESEVAHWHELDAGFAGRQKISPAAARAESIGYPREV
jgi:hypothetical protein